jgi:hypothetical protein
MCHAKCNECPLMAEERMLPERIAAIRTRDGPSLVTEPEVYSCPTGFELHCSASCSSLRKAWAPACVFASDDFLRNL